MGKTLAMIHSMAALTAGLHALAAELLPGVSVFHIVDEGLLACVLRAERVTPALCRRVASLAARAEADGADVVLLTCSALSPAVDVAAPLLSVPFFKMDQAMVERALQIGKRIGVLSTAGVTLESVSSLLRTCAAARGRDIEPVGCLCVEAMQAARAGRRAEHDRLVRAALANVASRCDVVVVAQASAASALTTAVLARVKTPVLTSPRLALEELATHLAAVEYG